MPAFMFIGSVLHGSKCCATLTTFLWTVNFRCKIRVNKRYMFMTYTLIVHHMTYKKIALHKTGTY